MPEIYGAFAEVYLMYNESIQSLAAELSSELIIPDIIVEEDEYPPHELIGMCEVMRFELWLKKCEKLEGYNFVIRIESEACTQEIFDGKRHDLSLWLANCISVQCDIRCLALLNDKAGAGYQFFNGECKKIGDIKSC